MKFSVITITYNDLVGLRRTVASVRAQRYTDYEYVIIDGGSTDGTQEFLATLPSSIRVVSERDRGIYDAMNKGVLMATGDYLVFMNGGDEFAGDEVLFAVAGQMDNSSTYAIYYGNALLVDAPRNEEYAMNVPGRISLESFYWDSPVIHQAVFASKSCFSKHGLFSMVFGTAGDYEWLVRCYVEGVSFTKLEGILARFYMGGASSRSAARAFRYRRVVAARNFPGWVNWGLYLTELLFRLKTMVLPFLLSSSVLKYYRRRRYGRR